MVRLAVVLWVTMSAGGLAVNALFGSVHAIPSRTDSPLMTSHFEGGATLALNLVAVIVLAGILNFARRDVGGALATDPICGMSVDVSAPAATRRRGTDIIYFCSPHCADRFDTGDSDSGMHEDIDGDQVDPICGMRVSSQTGLSGEKDGVTYYFCGEGCRQTFLEGPSRPVTLGRKPQ
jgi:YHS domain-containing protein